MKSRPPLFSSIGRAIGRFRRPQRGPRILCYVNHFHGPGSLFKGKSTSEDAIARRAVVERAIDGIRTSGFDIDLRICGIPGQTLVDIDMAFAELPDPRHLVFASIEHMAGRIGDYDYFLNVEDDILVPAETIANAIEFDRSEGLVEILHPNRLETIDGVPHCTDLRTWPGWTSSRRNYRGRRLAVAINAHSALMLLSAEKFAYARRHVELSFRGQIIGDLMASAYCNVHAPFALWRSFDDLSFHCVHHLDSWEGVVADPNAPVAVSF